MGLTDTMRLCGRRGGARSHPVASGCQAALIFGTETVLIMYLFVTMDNRSLTECNGDCGGIRG